VRIDWASVRPLEREISRQAPGGPDRGPAFCAPRYLRKSFTRTMRSRNGGGSGEQTVSRK
jgi:hypothetical protein